MAAIKAFAFASATKSLFSAAAEFASRPGPATRVGGFTRATATFRLKAGSGLPSRIETLAADIDALLAHLGIDRADLFGYSLGAGVALQTAIAYPSRVRKLVLASLGGL